MPLLSDKSVTEIGVPETQKSALSDTLAKSKESFFQKVREEADSAPLDADTAYKLSQKEFSKGNPVVDLIRGLIGKKE